MSAPVACEAEFVAPAARIRQYADAIGDANPAHADGAIAPPSFAVVPIVPLVVDARRSVSEGPGLHAEHDLTVFAPIRSGMTIRSTARVHGVAPTTAGLLIAVLTESVAAEGLLLNRQIFSVLVPTDRRQQSNGERAPRYPLPAGTTERQPVAEQVHELARDLGRRYAEASGDMSP